MLRTPPSSPLHATWQLTSPRQGQDARFQDPRPQTGETANAPRGAPLYFSISAFQHFSISAFQHFSISAFQHFSISAFQH
ncbi:MAG: hypothetical protein MUF31_09750, partial [Akkermansiaceae bacterium]|nr:hypothetical protein [Akkermansiaceae bacterium]